jgi:hypothetical protein
LPPLLIGKKRIPYAAEPSGIKGSRGKIFSVGMSTNADVKSAGFFIASAKSRCQAKNGKIVSRNCRTSVAQNILRGDAIARMERRSEARSDD